MTKEEIAKELYGLAGRVLKKTEIYKVRCIMCRNEIPAKPSEIKRIKNTLRGIEGYICINCKCCIRKYKRQLDLIKKKNIKDIRNNEGKT